MGSWAEIARVFVAGTVGIGMATALFAPGRTTTSAVQAGGKVVTGLFSTAVTGKPSA